LGFQWKRIEGGQTNVIQGAINAIYPLGLMNESLAGAYIVEVTNIVYYTSSSPPKGFKSEWVDLSLSPPFAVPQSVAGRTVNLAVKNAKSPFAPFGAGSLSFSASGSVYILSAYGTTVSSGTCSYAPEIDNTGILTLNDSFARDNHLTAGIH